MIGIFRVLLCCLLFVLTLTNPVKASLIGGELTYQSDTTATANPLRYFFKLVIYRPCGAAADLPAATLYLGDGISHTSDRAGKVFIANSCVACGFLSRSIYYFEHTFSGPGTFTASYREINRDVSQNIAKAYEQAFIITAEISIDVFDSVNVSPRFLPPIMPCAILNQSYRHSLAAINLNNDSLGYELITPLTSTNPFGDLIIQNVTGYTLPSQVSLNPKTGELLWDKPEQIGEYSFAVRVKQYRNKRLVGSIMRDFAVNVVPAPDNITQSFTIQNRADLSITDQNQIILTAGQPLVLKIKYETNGTAKRLLAYADLPLQTPPQYTLDTVSAGGVFCGRREHGYFYRNPIGSLASPGAVYAGFPGDFLFKRHFRPAGFYAYPRGQTRNR